MYYKGTSSGQRTLCFVVFQFHELYHFFKFINFKRDNKRGKGNDCLWPC